MLYIWYTIQSMHINAWYTFREYNLGIFSKQGEGTGASRNYLMAEQRIVIPEQRGGPDKTVVRCTCLDE